MANADARLQARERGRIHQIGDNARSHAPGDNVDNPKTVNIGRSYMLAA